MATNDVNEKMEQIFSVSYQLFAKHGFQKVSVHEIAQQANVSAATIYNYFGTKEQLYSDMLMNWMDKQLEQYECIFHSELSFPQKTKEIMLLEVRNLSMLSAELPKVSSEITSIAYLMDRFNEQKAMPFFIKFVALGKHEGYIHQDQTEEMTMFYFTMFKNELSRYWEGSNDERIAGGMEQLLELFFYGLVGQKRT